MITRDEIDRALRGSWRLLLGDARGMALFDVSIEGFWRSFVVLLLTLPAVVVDLAAQRRLPAAGHVAPEQLQGPTYWALGVLAYGLAWVAFPIVLAVLARPLGVSARYVPYMVARNWTTIVAIAPTFLITLLFALGFLPVAALEIGNLAAFGFSLWYSWRVASIACAAPPGLAGGLVALDTVLSLFVYTAVDRLIGL